MRKRIIIFMLFFLLIGVAICFLPLQQNINTTLEGLQCRINEAEYSEKITIRVYGKYNQYLFRDDTFKGKISTSIHGDIWSKKDGKLVFSDNNTQLISLSGGENDYSKNDYFGNLLCTKNFSEILILVGEETTPDSKGWYGENGLYVVAPADNKNDAINIAEKLSKRSVWLSECIWK